MNKTIFGGAFVLALLALLLAAVMGPRSPRKPEAGADGSRPARAGNRAWQPSSLSDTPTTASVAQQHLAPMASSPLPPAPPPPPVLPSWEDTTPLGLAECDDYRTQLQRVMRCKQIDDRKKELELERWKSMRAPWLGQLKADEDTRKRMAVACADEAKAQREAADALVCP